MRAILGLLLGLLIGGPALAQNTPAIGPYGPGSGSGGGTGCIPSGTTNGVLTFDGGTGCPASSTATISGGTLNLNNGSSAPLNLSNGAQPLNFINAGPATGAVDPEWGIQANVLGNVAYLQNLNTSGFSALTFRDAANYEHGAIGIDNSGSVSRPAAAVGTASISVTTMTVTAMASGSYQVGQTITGGTTSGGTKITAQSAGSVGVGGIAAQVLTLASASTATFGVGSILSGTGITPNTVITALGTGTGGAGTYLVYPVQTVSGGTTINGSGGIGTYTVNNSQSVSSGTLTGNGQDAGTNGNRTFEECSNLNGEPTPPDCEILQTFGPGAVQHVMLRFDPSQNGYWDATSGPGGPIFQTTHLNGYMAISGTTTGISPQAALDVYLGANNCAIIGRENANRGPASCPYGVNGEDLEIHSATPIVRFRVDNTAIADLYLDSTNKRLAVLDPIASGTAGPAYFYVDGTQLTELRGNVKLDAHIAAVSSAPTLTSCGTGSPSLDATASDVAGTVTQGTTATGCTITFHVAYATAPHCVVSSPNGAVLTSYSPSTTALTLVNASATGDVFTYVCIQ